MTYHNSTVRSSLLRRRSGSCSLDRLAVRNEALGGAAAECVNLDCVIGNIAAKVFLLHNRAKRFDKACEAAALPRHMSHQRQPT